MWIRRIWGIPIKHVRIRTLSISSQIWLWKYSHSFSSPAIVCLHTLDLKILSHYFPSSTGFSQVHFQLYHSWTIFIQISVKTWLSSHKLILECLISHYLLIPYVILRSLSLPRMHIKIPYPHPEIVGYVLTGIFWRSNSYSFVHSSCFLKWWIDRDAQFFEERLSQKTRIRL